MQFTMLAAFTLAIATLAAATPTRRQSDQCVTGAAQCCQSTQTTTAASTDPLSTILALLGIDLGSLTGDIGVTCTPISIIGASGGACSASPLCCTNNSFNGVVATGCTPIGLNL